MAKKLKKNKIKKIGEVPHYPHYEVRIASASYSNIAAVLAGFAFAAVVLIVQTDTSAFNQNTIILRDWATIAFLLSFIGCIISAFVFATVTGEEVLAPRSHTIALLGGTGFSISTNLVLYGLATISKIYMTIEISSFVNILFQIAMFITPLFVVFSAFDPVIGFENKRILLKDILLLFSFSFLPLVIALTIRLLNSPITISTITFLFQPSIIFAFIVILLSAASSLAVSSFADINFKFNFLVSGIIVGIHSIAVGIILIML